MDATVQQTSGFKTNFAVESKIETFYTGGAIQLSADGDSLYCSCNGCIHVVELSTGKVTKKIENDEDPILNFILSTDDTILVASLRSGLLKQWDMKTDTVTRMWKSIHAGLINIMAFNTEKCLLATGGTDSTVIVWDLINQSCHQVLRRGLGVYSVISFHRLNEFLLFGASDDYQIHVWDVALKKYVGTLKGHFSRITSLVFTEDKCRMLSSSRDQVVIVWDIVHYVAIQRLPIFEAIESLILLPSGRNLKRIGVVGDEEHVITAGNKGLLRVWNLNGKMVFSQKDALDSNGSDSGLVIAKACYNLARDIVVVVTHEHNILVHKLKDFSVTKQLVGFHDDVFQVVFVGGDTHFAVATNSHHIKVFEIETLDCTILKGHTDIVMSLDVFPSNPFLMASCSKDNSIRIWMMNKAKGTFQCVAIGIGHTLNVNTISCSRLTTTLVATSGKDMCIKLWEIPGNLSTSMLELDKPYSLDVRWTEVAHEREINSVCIAPNDKFVATGSRDKLVKIWNCLDGQLMSTLRGHNRGIWCIRFSPVDRVVATGSSDCTIKIWSLSDFSCVKTFEGHESSILSIAFVCHGMQLISSASDGLIKLWTIKLNECVKTLDEHNGKVWTLNLDYNESRMLTGDSNSTIIVWKDVTEIEKQEELQKNEELLAQEQDLTNLLMNKNYAKALGLTITLEQPFRALTILKEICMLPNGDHQLEKTFNKLREDQVDAILRFAVSWNQNSKHCHEAQRILNLTLKRFPVEELLKWPTMKENVQGLLPYTERHLQRLTRLLQQATFVEYTWQNIKLPE